MQVGVLQVVCDARPARFGALMQHPAVRHLLSERIDHPLDVARPFLWVAGVFFNLGFWGCLAFRALAGS